MPELPEVENWRRLAAQTTGLRIRRAEAAPDLKIFDRNPPAVLARALTGCRITATHRRGKHLWLNLDSGQDLYVHFGMTGSLWRLRPEEASPSHLKLCLELEDGSRLLYRNLRRIGRVRLLDDAAVVPPVSELAPDPLEAGLPVDWLTAQLAARKCPIKAALLDQSLFAGVGNWIADEVLYQSRISPHLRACELGAVRCARLHRELLRILERAVAVNADSERFPRGWLFHRRWGKQAGTDARGDEIHFDVVGGRTTAWVPARQRE